MRPIKVPLQEGLALALAAYPSTDRLGELDLMPENKLRRGGIGHIRER